MTITEVKLMSLIANCIVPGVPADYMSAIIKQESRMNVYAINNNATGQRLLPTNESEIEFAKGLLKNAKTENIDFGLGQINSQNIERFSLNGEKLFDPCYNINKASLIFKSGMNRVCKNGVSDKCLGLALRLYNTGKSKRTNAGDDYVSKVLAQLGKTDPNKMTRIEGTDLFMDKPISKKLIFKN